MFWKIIVYKLYVYFIFIDEIRAKKQLKDAGKKNRHIALLTSRVRFKLQRVPDERICVSNARDWLQFFPVVQVVFQQLVGDICQKNNANRRGYEPKTIHTDERDHLATERHGDACVPLWASQCFIMNLLLDFGPSWQVAKRKFHKHCYKWIY